jgi:hypothetical protein
MGKKRAMAKAKKDKAICLNYFGAYMLDTQVKVSKGKWCVVHIQPFLSGKQLTLDALSDVSIRTQVKALFECYERLVADGHTPVDLIGAGGAFRPILDNVLITPEGTLKIIDATLLEARGLPRPFVWVLKWLVLFRQNKTMELFKQKAP